MNYRTIFQLERFDAEIIGIVRKGMHPSRFGWTTCEILFVRGKRFEQEVFVLKQFKRKRSERELITRHFKDKDTSLRLTPYIEIEWEHLRVLKKDELNKWRLMEEL